MGQRTGLLAALAEASGNGSTADQLAERLDLDPFYVGTWCRAAFAAQVCDRDGDVYRLAPHMATLLLDETAPGFVGATFRVLEQDELFGRFERHLASGERLWWNECSQDFIRAVSGTGRPFYRRLVPGGLSQVPGLPERLAAGCRVLDSACGAGRGLIMLAEAYPECELVGVDGDAYSLEVAEEYLRAAGLAGRVTLVHSPLEKMSFDRPIDLVINNISMHECRDIDEATRRVKDALAPGGWFVISDFPYPDDDAGLRSAPDDQLVPRRIYDDLLARHGFREIGSSTLTPMHALTYGRR
jgi:SAM-dependent methyltransferase